MKKVVMILVVVALFCGQCVPARAQVILPVNGPATLDIQWQRAQNVTQKGKSFSEIITNLCESVIPGVAEYNNKVAQEEATKVKKANQSIQQKSTKKKNTEKK